MSFAKHGLASQSIDLGKTVLALSALGLFTKLLHIDLSQLQILGVSLSPASSSLVPGFLGLALIYAFIAFSVARIEAAVERQTNKETVEATKIITDSKPLLALMFLIFPFSVFVYSMPYVLGAFAINLLWSDSMTVVTSIWALATK
ncbi:MAG: hypothetical protein ACYC2W_07315 [Desulfurivibrionaceae bacterium]